MSHFHHIDAAVESGSKLLALHIGLAWFSPSDSQSDKLVDVPHALFLSLQDWIDRLT